MEYDDRVMCPLIDEKIDPMECVDVVDCVLNPLFLNSLPKKYKAKENFKNRIWDPFRVSYERDGWNDIQRNNGKNTGK